MNKSNTTLSISEIVERAKSSVHQETKDIDPYDIFDGEIVIDLIKDYNQTRQDRATLLSIVAEKDKTIALGDIQYNKMLGKYEKDEKVIRDIEGALTKHKCTSICTERADEHTTPNKLEKAGVPCLFCEVEKSIIGSSSNESE
jgi:hypothetical protein